MVDTYRFFVTRVRRYNIDGLLEEIGYKPKQYDYEEICY
jgi:hypothetical protein